jgi:hypothetical protein
MSLAILACLAPNRRHLPGSSCLIRFLILPLLCFLPLCAPAASHAKETCPWLNEATASGFLDASVTSVVTHSEKNKDDANCEFTHRDGTRSIVLLIEVETMSEPFMAFASYKARCGSDAEPIRAIGNEAILCSLNGKKKEILGQVVVGRVRDRAFMVKITSNEKSDDRDELRKKARQIAEQVAGILF